MDEIYQSGMVIIPLHGVKADAISPCFLRLYFRILIDIDCYLIILCLGCCWYLESDVEAERCILLDGGGGN